MPYAAFFEADLGAMYYAQGAYAFGETHFKRAVDLATKSFGESHRWTTTISAMYAACMKAGGKVKEAKAIERAARGKANESQSPFAIWNKQITIADEAVKEKKFPEAEAALKQALQASQDVSTEPMLQAVALTRYGQLALLQNKPAMACDKWKAAQAIADATLGPEDKTVMQHVRQLAELQRSQSRYAEAEPLYLRIVANAKNEFGPESDEYAKSLSEIADVYTSWAQYPKAAVYYSKLLAFQEKKFGVDSEKLIPTLVSLGNVAQNETRYLAEVNEKAEVHLKRASDLATKHFGKNSNELTGVLDALSRYYQRHLDWDKAAKACTLIIAADEKNFGPNSAETIKALEHYAVVLRAAGQRDAAEPIEARIAKAKGTKSADD
jgi:tetratricopeptide (TPR) repeat protein